MPIAADRRWPKTTLTSQVREEPWQRVGERDRTTPPAATDEAGNHQPQHLLNRAADLLDEPLVRVTTTSPALTLGHERIDMNRQLPDDPGATRTAELRELDQQRHPPQHRPRRVAVLSQPGDYRSISGPIHDARIRSTVCGLTKYASSMDNFLSVDGWRKHPRQTRPALCACRRRHATPNPVIAGLKSSRRHRGHIIGSGTEDGICAAPHIPSMHRLARHRSAAARDRAPSPRSAACDPTTAARPETATTQATSRTATSRDPDHGPLAIVPLHPQPGLGDPRSRAPAVLLAVAVLGLGDRAAR